MPSMTRLALSVAALALALPGVAAAQSPAASPGMPAGPVAHVVTTGDVVADVVLPMDPDSELPDGDGTFDLRWQDGSLDTLVLSLDVSGGAVTSAFVGVGVPGTSIADSTYFADFVRTQCTVTATLGAAGVSGTIACTDLQNALSGPDAKTIDLQVDFAAAAPGAPATMAPSPAPSSGVDQTTDSLRLVTTGDVAVNLTMARTDATTFVDSGTGTQLVFADDQGNTGTITFDIDMDAEPPLFNAFIALGLPGTSIFDPLFFADSLHTQCELTPTRVLDTEIAGAFACTDLTNGDGTKSIQASGSFAATR